jgi:hypothetical protein
MSREAATIYVFGGEEWEQHVGTLCQQAQLAARRQRKAPPGDRKERVRYDQLSAQVQERALTLTPARTIPLEGGLLEQLDAAGPHHAWCRADEVSEHPLVRVPEVVDALRDGGVAFEVRDPFFVGETPLPTREEAEPIPPAEPWRPGGADVDDLLVDVSAFRAQQALWDSQLQRIVAGEDIPLVPSGVINSILTEGLRTYADADAGPKRLARVVYRDGSEAQHPFPLAALPLTTTSDSQARLLRFALMSVRHPEMDPEVDGAWLRNRIVSQVRPAAETDEVVYDITRQRLRELSDVGPVTLRIFQTGLEPAVVGFYRALCDHLLTGQGDVSVEPFYWRHHAKSFEPGTPWRIR